MSEQRPRTRWQKFRLVVKVVELRLRFIALMAATGLVFAYWDTLWNHYEKWTRPAGASTSRRPPASSIYCPMHPQVVQDAAGHLPDLRHAAVEAEEGGEGDAARGRHRPRRSSPRSGSPRRASGPPRWPTPR